MTTYNTMNPVPSADARDRYDNSQVFDELMNGAAPSTPDRLGVLRQSWSGMEQAFNQFLINSGFEPNHLTYVDGSLLQVDRPTQLIDRAGSVYRVKMPASFPVELSGTWAADEDLLVDVGDQSLRTELALPTGASQIGFGDTTVSSILGNFKFPQQFPTLQAWASSGGNLAITGGVYPITEQLNFPVDTVLTTFGHVKFDASGAVNAASFANNCVMRIGQVSLTPIPASTITLSKGAQRIDFASAHGLQPNDIGVIYNPTDGSYLSARTYYRAGEYFRVATTPLTDRVFVDSGFFATYTAPSVNLYKMNKTKFTLVGSLEVVAPEALNNVLAVRMQCCVDSDITNLNAFSKNTVAALELEKCFNVSGTGVVGIQTSLSGTSNDYGLIFSNCQHMRISGYFSGSRHGVTTGGYSDIGSVPCRDIEVRGVAKTTFQGAAHAVNTHGNTEYFKFDGVIYGGFDGGGNHITVKGDIHAQTDGICIYHFEMSGYDRDYSGVRCFSEFPLGNTSQGVVDLSGVNTATGTDTASGIVDMSGMIIDAPLAVTAFKLVQRGPGANSRVILRGSQVRRAAAGYASAVVTHQAPNPAFLEVDMGSFNDPGAASQSHTAVTLRGVEISGWVDIAVTTGTGTASATVTFPVGIFNAANAPNVVVSTNTGLLGGTKPMANTNTPSAASFVITLNPPAGGNFGANSTVRAYWQAKTVR